nr:MULTISPECIES: hypothetical protein [Pandoraea]
MMKNRDISVAEISRQFGVSRSTLYNLQAKSNRTVELRVCGTRPARQKMQCMRRDIRRTSSELRLALPLHH